MTLGLAQAGEFGFVLLSFAQTSYVLPIELTQQLLLIVAVLMLLSPALSIGATNSSPRDLAKTRSSRWLYTRLKQNGKRVNSWLRQGSPSPDCRPVRSFTPAAQEC